MFHRANSCDNGQRNKKKSGCDQCNNQQVTTAAWPFYLLMLVEIEVLTPVVRGTHCLHPVVPHGGQGFLNGDICSFKSHTGSLGLKKAAMFVCWLLVSTNHRSSCVRVKELPLTTFATRAEALKEKKKKSPWLRQTQKLKDNYSEMKSAWQIVSSSVNDIFIFSCSKATPKDLESQYLTERVCSLEVIFSGST